MDSSSLSHTRYKCQYHIVFIPKYRKRIMYGRLKADVREIIKKLCDYRNIEIVEGAVCADHVHLDISSRPTDTRTLIPFLKDMELYLPFKYQEIVADSKLTEIKDELTMVDYSEFNHKYNQRDIDARQKMRDLVDSDANKVTKVFSTLF